MDISEFGPHLKDLEVKITGAMREDLLHISANKAAEMFANNFKEGSFFGDSWADLSEATVKRRKFPDAKILVQTGILSDSIKTRVEGNKAIVESDTVYGKVHNEGLRAGRGKGFRMPKRQFIGNHDDVEKAIEDEIKKRLGEL
jgi:phage gpG-like protein